MLATRSVGWRVKTLWMISEAMVSWMARSDTRTRLRMSTFPKPSKVALAPHPAAKKRLYPLSPRWKATGTDASANRAQTGSWDLSPSERPVPLGPGTGAGRTWMMRAPRVDQ